MKIFQAYELLAKYGIKTPKYKVYEIDQEFYFDSFPAILRIVSDKVKDIEEVGGIRYGIHSNQELQQAKWEIINNLQKNSIFLDINDLFLVEEEVRGTPFYIGGVFDEVFREVLLFGKGGETVSIEEDLCYIDTNAKRKEILKSFKTTKISKIFPNFKGRQYKIEYVIEVVEKFQKLFTQEEITSFEINPLVYTPNGFVALDAKIKKEKKPKYTPPRSSSIFRVKSVAIVGEGKEEVAKNISNAKLYTSTSQLPPVDLAILINPKELDILALSQAKTILILNPAPFLKSKIKKLQQSSTVLFEDDPILYFNSSLKLNLTPHSILEGEIALISQSGSLLQGLVDKALAYSIGFSHLLGEGGNFEVAGVLEELELEKNCKFINLHIHSLRDGKRFLEAIRKSSKRISLYKTTKMCSLLAFSAGAIIKEDLDELIFAPYYQEKKVMVISNSQGLADVFIKIIENHNRKLHTPKEFSNPFVTTNVKELKEVLKIVEKEDILTFLTLAPTFEVELVRELVFSYPTVIPVLFAQNSFEAVFKELQQAKRLYFNDLENVANIL
ncbi:MAG: CoA-binding protein [Epsilonproteobacteria bacterium]|nr:CoA-binding protein [Campylobacterota bacterium]